MVNRDLILAPRTLRVPRVVALAAVLAPFLERIIVRLDHFSRDDAGGFGQICADLERFLDDLKTHGQKEMELLQHSFVQEEGGEG